MSFQKSWLTNPVTLIEDPIERIKKYIIEPDLPEIHDPKPYYHPAKINLMKLYHIPDCPASSTIGALRDTFGNIVDFVEVPLENAGTTSKNSMSLQRAPGLKNQETRGSSVNYPFWPGGFDEPEKDILELEIDNYDFEHNLLTKAPGLDEGMDFKIHKKQQGDVIDLLSVIEDEESVFQIVEKNDNTVTKIVDDPISCGTTIEEDDALLSLPSQRTVLKISEAKDAKKTKTEWAEELDVTKPVKDFHLKIPDPAHKYPFELDIFQKQAIIKLEEHHHVFVAAHTSAGKTVVAEYAIALSRKHMTRTIYTSPIKALSNQKYHDFKKTFGDVGLITGDIQIDSTASCLIMTTEILRSMLYCGSDVTRDLEYVVFDEVHYLNDPDRGHVWEEVLILLPDHVCIVMLSATVPNTMEFANWVGQTKKRKVFVISTAKRPVPLEHNLYTGCGGKSRNDIFMIVNEKSEFKIGEYEKAKASKAERQKDMQKTHNVIKAQMKMTPKQEKTMWVGFVDYLRRNDKMPVIVFTLSRNRCDDNAETLASVESVELCTSNEKYKIKTTFQRCLQRLKPIDQQLPQVKQLERCLKRGIGIHHSGVLPILKEAVEILFQQGLVKLLFATETFAMGVNMPARTVIFDSIKKYTGKEWRMLQPAEYTQMAGRAGRRGIDKSGTVIILCKQDIPDETHLRYMILGKPKQLESQFRLTYAMILNILRVEHLTVEDMMSHSFRESFRQCQIPQNKSKLQNLQNELNTLTELSEHLKPLCKFYETSIKYIQAWKDLAPKYILDQKIQNEMKPGRVLIICYNQHFNKLALLLQAPKDFKSTDKYKVLVSENQETTSVDEEDLWYAILALASPYKKFIPDGLGGHSIIEISAVNIHVVTQTSLKLECDKILRDWQQRQLPRFRDAPTGPTVIQALTELKGLTDKYNLNAEELGCLKVSQNLNLHEAIKHMEGLRNQVLELEKYTDMPNFDQEFKVVYKRKRLEDELVVLQKSLSTESLLLYPDYRNKIKVLQELNYIDNLQQVTMKGRVACEMSQNELIITELVLGNILTDLEPAEIAALLSSIIFQEKTDIQPKLNNVLEKGREEIIKVDKYIEEVELSYNVGGCDENQGKDRLNFGLMEVVYEWARNKPFSNIMELTDVKEGIIVRCIQQLNEILKDVKDAARIIGNSTLPNKMEEASNAIKRDIVFAASLYTTDDNIFIAAPEEEEEENVDE